MKVNINTAQLSKYKGEAEIDRMVYELYGLTEEEISIIDNGK